MLSPQLRRKIFDLWTKLWSSGMTNPLTSIEQITYLLFIKQMEKVDSDRQKPVKLNLWLSEQL
ncbi:MAG: type I restriction-modification system subunit M N-terminal domain-containing protein [Blastocatellia bacterium]|nr:type I restriction-modification system subunit M N-terminal domain-containing protein [Blastocatellia bacterium]